MKKILIVALSILALFSCKKEEETELREYLSGGLLLDFPKFVEPGYTKTFCLDTIEHTVSRPDGGKIGFYFRINNEKKDTLIDGNGNVRSRTFTISAPEESGSYSFTLSAFCDEKYYSTMNTVNYDVIIPGFDGTGSMQNYSILDDELSFTDERDGKSYFYVKLAGLDWMRQNLAWDGSGCSYQNSKVMDGLVGRIYNQNDALVACPEGWRLPSDKEWTAMAKIVNENAKEGENFEGVAGAIMSGAEMNGEKLWEYWREVYISDQLRLSILPVAYAIYENREYVFQNTEDYAAIWTADFDEKYGYIRYIFERKDIVYYGKVDPASFACSVRCVRDSK